jgi:hypothetical protein
MWRMIGHRDNQSPPLSLVCTLLLFCACSIPIVCQGGTLTTKNLTNDAMDVCYMLGGGGS